MFSKQLNKLTQHYLEYHNTMLRTLIEGTGVENKEELVSYMQDCVVTSM